MRAAKAVASILAAALWSPCAEAVPAFAGQTGLACSACHVGAFGPQLTPYGRAFKIQGYTIGGGSGPLAQFPLSAMFLTSYTNTQKGQSAAAAEHYGNNGNFAMDQISVFLAGRVNDHLGGLIQGTFSGITSQFYVDNSDIRLVTESTLLGYQSELGLSLNNSPALSDPYNSTYPFGYNFVASALAVTPNAKTILNGPLAGNTLGLTGYAWIDQHLYIDAGLYKTQAPGLMKLWGESYGPGSTTGVAPYLRGVYEWNWGDNDVHLGAAVFYGRFNPAIAPRSADGSFGHNTYTDLFADAGYQYLGNRDTFTVDARLDNEIQNLRGSSNPLGPAFSSSQPNNRLVEWWPTATYYYMQTYGLTLSWDKLWGKRNPALYNNGSPDFGSVKGSPDSNAVILEADWVPFGKDQSWGAPLANLKIGLQYTIYTEFSGSGRNYDGFGRNASDNNTLYLFLWTIF